VADKLFSDETPCYLVLFAVVFFITFTDYLDIALLSTLDNVFDVGGKWVWRYFSLLHKSRIDWHNYAWTSQCLRNTQMFLHWRFWG